MGVNVKETLPPIRNARGLTQKELGLKARIERTDINAFEKGTKTVGAARLQRIAEALDVSPAELGAPLEPADVRGKSLADRQQELEADVVRLTKLVGRLGRRVAALERQAPPGSQKGRAAR